MRLSLNVTDYSWSDGARQIATHLAEVVRAAEDGGLDAVWVADHLLQGNPNSAPEAEMLEAYTTLGFLGAQTRTIGLGTMVSGVTYRAPALLIKAVTTLDVLTGGRAWLGVGAGYHAEEARMMGLSLPPTPERFDRLEETLQLAFRMWSGDDSAFEGQRYRLDRPVSSPSPISQPHPPVLVGGAGERRTLRLVAQYADACNLFDIPDGGATVRRKLSVLQRHCEEVGRPYEAIEKTLSTRFEAGETPGVFARRCAEFASWGIEHVVVIMNGPWTRERVESLAAAVPALRALDSASPGAA